ncbi:hypothetical protein ACQP2Y_14935 [Actinoplanes sp. CA-051413]|uniref:hypothetical protein n=1 Tax=Actinoplanes sp. CA-051413 TaxID=3239899 RepID=UPI003D955E87
MSGPALSGAESEEVRWHDVRLHGFGFSPGTFELLLDIDYILQWREPPAGEEYYEFVVAPATLVFHSVADVRIDLQSYTGEVSIDTVQREDAQPTPAGVTDYAWLLNTHEGTIRFRAAGFQVHLRQDPRVSAGPSLTLTERGGVSFDRPRV